MHARALRNAGKLDESRPFLSRAINEYLGIFLTSRSQSAHLGLIDSLGELGGLEVQEDNYACARQTLELAERELEELDVDSDIVASLRIKTTAHLLRLSNLEGDESRIARYSRQLDILLRRNEATGSLQIDVGRLVDCKLDLGLSFLRFGRTDLAEECFLSAHDLAYDPRGKTIRKIDTSRLVCIDCYLGGFYESEGRYDRAYAHFVDALSCAREAFPRPKYPNGHSVLFMALRCVGNHLWCIGESEAAARVLRELCELTDGQYPKNKNLKGRRARMLAHASLGRLLRQVGALDEASTHLLAALGLAEAIYPTSQYPEGHDELADSWRQYGKLQLASGRIELARKLFNLALDSYKRRYSERDQERRLRIALTLADLGRTFLRVGRL